MKRALLSFFLFLLFSDTLQANAGNISTAPSNESFQDIPSFQKIPDKLGKNFILWENSSTIEQSIPRFFIQQVNQSGVSIWGKDVELSSDSNQIQNSHKLIADGYGGVIITWEERTVQNEETNLFIQKIDSSGNKLWGTRGRLVSAVSGSQISPFISSDGNGGAFIVWSDSRNDLTGSNWDIYAQRINAEGEALWQEGGLAISTDSKDEYIGKILPADDGGITVVWNMVIPDISGTAEGYEFYFRKISSEGELVQTFNKENFLSLPVSNTNYALGGDILSDGNNGFFLSLAIDGQQMTTSLYLQHVLKSGDLAYAGTYGLLVDSDIQNVKEINFQTDTTGNIMMTWFRRDDSTSILYTRHFDGNGDVYLVNSEPIQLESAEESPNFQSKDTLSVVTKKRLFAEAETNLNVRPRKTKLTERGSKRQIAPPMDVTKTVIDHEENGGLLSTADPAPSQELKLAENNRKQIPQQAGMPNVELVTINLKSINHDKELHVSTSIHNKTAEALAHAHKISYSKPFQKDDPTVSADITYRNVKCLESANPLPDRPVHLLAVN